MKTVNLKYYIFITLIILVDSFHNIYFNSDAKLDVYLFYEKSRYLDNILFDISRMFSFSVLSYLLIRQSRIVFKPLFIMSIGIWISYFTFYNQISSLFIIPLYVLSVIYYNRNKFKNGRRAKN